jgi:hypothetical protein
MYISIHIYIYMYIYEYMYILYSKKNKGIGRPPSGSLFWLFVLVPVFAMIGASVLSSTLDGFANARRSFPRSLSLIWVQG